MQYFNSKTKNKQKQETMNTNEDDKSYMVWVRDH